jgi:hypothetical protein
MGASVALHAVQEWQKIGVEAASGEDSIAPFGLHPSTNDEGGYIAYVS